MTDQQISIVKDTWKIFPSIDPLLAGDVFYGQLFITAPKLQHMFLLTREDQSKKLVEMLSMPANQDQPYHEKKN